MLQMSEFTTDTSFEYSVDCQAEHVVRLAMYGDSVKGEKAGHPDNDDSWFADPAHGTLGVFDGVSGAPGSFAASQIAAQETERQLAALDDVHDVRVVSGKLAEALLDAHQGVVEARDGTQTTAVIAKIFETEESYKYAAIASSGDSRAYLWREGELRMLTLDHDMLATKSYLTEEDRWQRQMILAELNTKNLSKLVEEVPMLLPDFHNRNVVSSVLGQPGTPAVFLATIELQPGDRLLLTTDGVHDNLTHQEMAEIIGSESDDAQLVSSLIEWAELTSHGGPALNMRAKRDDMTAVVATIE